MSDTHIPSLPTDTTDREQFWRDTLAASGLSAQAFCAARSLPEKRFCTWRKNLGLSPVGRPAARGFVPVRVGPDATAEVVLPGGVTLRVPVTADPAHVGRLVVALRGATC